MSEINSIANGTFTIGATSANDSSLLVTENDSNVSILSTPQEVSHDNTLSGNGTVDSPLGVVNGYNETVLFTSSWNDKLWNVNLSEPVSSFKKIRMYVTRGDGANEPKSYEYETSLLPNYLTLEVDTILTNDIYRYFTLCVLSGSTYTELSARLMNYPNTLSDWNNTNSWCHPIKIVGINRKAQ